MKENEDPFLILKELAEKFHEGVIIYEAARRTIVYTNSVGQNITGLKLNSSSADLEAVFGRLRSEERKYLLEYYESIDESSINREVEFRMVREDYSLLNVCASAYTVMKGMFTVLLIKDISKNKEHENYLVEFGAKKNATLDAVVHFISGSISLTQHLSAQAERSIEVANESDLKIYLGLIIQNTRDCLHVVNEVLREEHIKSPEVPLKISRIDINEKVNYIVEKLRAAYPLRTLAFTNTSAKILVNVDEIKVLQIVNNLLSNSLKFTHMDNAIRIHIADKGAHIIITVEDEGIGIPADLQQFIFNKHSAAGRTGLKGEKSFGIGLHICQQLALLMNGKIWFESEEGRGSAFYLLLPKW